MFIRFHWPEFLTKRYWRHWWQRRVRGWDDSDTWSLDLTMAKFILPRLKRYKEVNNGYPGNFTEESWDAVLDKMIFAMEVVKSDDFCSEGLEEAEAHWTKVHEGLELFGKHFRELWW